ncbi:MAG: hypothetical protein KGZ83_17480 [Sulfuricella sp.]|nr:hypothetical protein [Sulfuricella sp.]
MKNALKTGLACWLAAMAMTAEAGTCSNKTLEGSYVFKMSLGNLGWLLIDEVNSAGKATFSNGKISAGSTSIKSSSVTSATPILITLDGVYSIDINCVATGYFSIGGPPKTNFRIYLDTLDTSKPTNTAYHGEGMIWENSENGWDESGSGPIEIRRVNGKF